MRKYIGCRTHGSTGDYNSLSAHEESTYLKRVYFGIYYGFSLVLLIIFIHKLSNMTYYDIGEDQSNSQHKRRTGWCGLREHCVISWSSYGPKQCIPSNVFQSIISILLISCLSKISVITNIIYSSFFNISYYDIVEYQLSAQLKRSTGDCCLREHCVDPSISYIPKQGLP